jgi:type III pantothenate kinase
LNLIIDIGNTCAKVAIFDKTSIVEQLKFVELTLTDIKNILQSQSGIKKAILSNVAKPVPEIQKFLKSVLNNFIELSGDTPLPFANLYESKATQGTDRIAAIAGASFLYPDTDVMIIDAGTAITYDFIDSSGIYKGGNISPGIDSRYKSLHMFTHNLPLLNKKEINNFFGKNTNEAIESGVLNGIIYEIEGYTASLKKEYNNLKVIITGGDATFLAGKIKNVIFAELNLVLTGLNSILEYNVNR